MASDQIAEGDRVEIVRGSLVDLGDAQPVTGTVTLRDGDVLEVKADRGAVLLTGPSDVRVLTGGDDAV